MPFYKMLRNLIRLIKKIVPANVWAWMRQYRADYQTSKAPDRVVLIKEIIPALPLTGAVLWIGCRRYTKDYYGLIERRGARCWTMDIDPGAKQWGRSGRHIIGDILDLKKLYSDQRFDVIFCNGIFGWGVDSAAMQQQAAEAMAAVSKPGGWMLLGWDTNRIADPLQNVAPWFAHASLPEFGERKIIEGYYSHVYDLFRRR